MSQPEQSPREALAGIREREFPVAQRLTYLNHAGIAPLPSRVVRAMTAALEELHRHGAAHYEELVACCERTRGLAARLLGAAVDEIAFVPSTSHGLSLVAFGLDWRPGDNVVLSAHEFPANVYPWWAQRDRGVEVRTAPAPRGWVGPDDIAPLLDGRTRVVALSSVQFARGGRTDLPGVAAVCRERGVLLVVDGIQSVGAAPLDVTAAGVDVLVADGHKWLLGPEGQGIFFCRRAVLEELRLSVAGWHSVAEPLRFEELRWELQPDASRFEPGSLDRVAAVGLGAALDLLLEVGLDRVAARIQELTEYLLAGLDARGIPVLSPRDPAARSGIVTCGTGREAPAAAAQRLHDAGICVSARGGGLRASPHFYNTEEELDRLLAGLTTS